MTPLEKFDEDLKQRDLDAALANLGESLADEGRLHELFELRKIQLRYRLGLPVEIWRPIDDLPREQGQALENGLLEICREIGARWMRRGDVATGWSYLEPVGDKALVRELLDDVPVTDENVEAIIHICVSAGIDPLRGFRLVLERYGTCTAITTCETQLATAVIETRRGPLGLLVEHVYQELLTNIRRSLGKETSVDAESGELRDAFGNHPELTGGLGHQIDTTHLASTVKYSKILDDPRLIDLAIELAEYGLSLHKDFQYRGTIPFEDTYRDTLQFLRALRGTDVEAALQRLETIARAADDIRLLDPAAWYVYLLDRLGRGEQAIAAWLELLHPHLNEEHLLNEDIVRPLTTIARDYRLYELAGKTLRDRGDLILYATIEAARREGSIAAQPLGLTDKL